MIGTLELLTYACDHHSCGDCGEVECESEEALREDLHHDGWVTIDGKDYCRTHANREPTPS